MGKKVSAISNGNLNSDMNGLLDYFHCYKSPHKSDLGKSINCTHHLLLSKKTTRPAYPLNEEGSPELEETRTDH